LAFSGIGVDTLVVDARRGHPHRTRSGEYLSLVVVAVADHQPMPVLVDLTGMGVDVGGDLGPATPPRASAGHRRGRSHRATSDGQYRRSHWLIPHLELP
jgi:hypothetical protein